MSPQFKWTIRALFWGPLLVIGAWFLYPAFSMGGGQSLLSPDERFHALVWRQFKKSAPFDFKISDAVTNEPVMQFRISPTANWPIQEARGGPRIFEWTPDSRQLKIRLDDQLWATIEMPLVSNAPKEESEEEIQTLPQLPVNQSILEMNQHLE